MESLLQSIRMLENLLKEKLSAREGKEIYAELLLLQAELKKEFVSCDTRPLNEVIQQLLCETFELPNHLYLIPFRKDINRCKPRINEEFAV